MNANRGIETRDTVSPRCVLEAGVAPDRIVATKYVSDQPQLGIQMTRPICPFPKIPRYAGAGDTNDAANFVCADSTATNNPVPAPEYLH